MAIILVIPKKKQNKIIIMISAFLVLALFALPLIILNPWQKQEVTTPSSEETYRPEITIDLAAISSKAVSDLTAFTYINLIFNYQAKDKLGKAVSGTISADSVATATTMLEARGLTVTSVQVVVPGRAQPFLPY